MKPEDLYLRIINNLYDGVYFVDTERRITFWNKAAETITGYKKEEILGKCCQSNLLNHIDENGRPLCLAGCPLHASIIDGQQRQSEVFLRHREGYRIPVRINIFPIEEKGEIVGAIEIFSPNSPVVYDDKLIERLSELAMSDQLTGLANRRKIESHLEYRFHEWKRFRNKFCVVFLDLDNFGAFNNAYGHEMGDEILVSIARSIRGSMRSSDLVGRWGGEEFLGIFEIKDDYEATLLAERLRILVERSEVILSDKSLSVTASLGVTTARDGDDPASILRRADALMYKSKQKGKNRITSDGARA